MPPRRKKPTKSKKSSIPELGKSILPQKITKSKNVIKGENESCRSLRPRQGKNLTNKEIDSCRSSRPSKNKNLTKEEIDLCRSLSPSQAKKILKEEQFNCEISVPICENDFYDSETSSDNIENSDYEEITNEDLLKEYSLLLSLQKKEDDLKTAILYEKLKKEEALITDENLLCKSILELKNVIVKVKEDWKAKNTMYPHIQMSEVMQEVLSPQDTESEKFTEEKKKIMLDLLLERKELKKKICEEQLEITAFEEECLQLRLTMDKTIRDLEQSKHMETDPHIEEELKQLEKDNQSRGTRIQLLAKIVKALIDNIEEEKEDMTDLNKLSSANEKILKWNYDDIDELEDLCKAVYSTNIG